MAWKWVHQVHQKMFCTRKSLFYNWGRDLWEKQLSKKRYTFSEHLRLTCSVVLFFLWWHCDREIIFQTWPRYLSPITNLIFSFRHRSRRMFYCRNMTYSSNIYLLNIQFYHWTLPMIRLNYPWFNTLNCFYLSLSIRIDVLTIK